MGSAQITLDKLCEPYPQISIASSQNNEEILNFFRQSAMVLTSGRITFDQSPDFFGLHRVQGPFSKTILLRNLDGTLTGLVSLTAISGRYRGEEIIWAYASDRRFSPQMEKSTKSQFRSFYSDLVLNANKIEDLGCPAYVLSIISDENEKAKKALFRPEGLLLYRPVWAFKGRAILARLPRFFEKANKVRFCKAVEVSDLKNFISIQIEDKQFSFSLKEISSRLEALNRSWEDFLILRDKKGDIVGAALLASENQFRRPVVELAGWKIRWISQLAAVLGQPPIPASGELRTSNLTYITLARGLSHKEQRRVHMSLIDRAWAENLKKPREKRDHVMVLLDSDKRASLDYFRYGYISRSIPATMYQLMNRDHDQNSDLLQDLDSLSVQIDTTFL